MLQQFRCSLSNPTKEFKSRAIVHLLAWLPFYRLKEDSSMPRTCTQSVRVIRGIHTCSHPKHVLDYYVSLLGCYHPC